MTPRQGGSTFRRISGRLRIVGGESFAEIQQELREAPILGEPAFCPYRQAEIGLVSVSVRDLCPCALYVLNDGLTNVRETTRQLLELGVDIFNLSSDRTSLWLEEDGAEDEGRTLTPPLIEVSEDDGNAMVIVDGLHRIVIARESGLETITVIRIRGSAAPIPSLPVPWEAVKKLDSVPPSDQKRNFRFTSSDELFEWQLKYAERFARGFNLPQGIAPVRWVGTYVWNKHGRFKPFPENLQWVRR